MADSKSQYYYGLGRRKSATARARLYTKGSGSIKINDLPALEYFDANAKLEFELREPLRLVDMNDNHDVTIVVSGGGVHGQVGACKLAISKAIAELNEDLRGTLKREGLLKRDPREKERKKYGLRKARKTEQFSKR